MSQSGSGSRPALGIVVLGLDPRTSLSDLSYVRTSFTALSSRLTDYGNRRDVIESFALTKQDETNFLVCERNSDGAEQSNDGTKSV